MNEGLAGALAVLSLALAIGWTWFNKNPVLQNLKQRWPGRAAEFFYGAGLPYLALIFGVLPPRLLGLKGLEYFGLVSTGSPLTDLRLALTWWAGACLADAGVMMAAGLAALVILGATLAGLRRGGLPLSFWLGWGQVSVWFTREIFYRPLHWAFYWAIFWLITGNLYLGLIFGVGWAILEGGALAWRQKNDLSRFLINTIILILLATIFFYRQNLWLLWPIYGALAALAKSYKTIPEV